MASPSALVVSALTVTRASAAAAGGALFGGGSLTISNSAFSAATTSVRSPLLPMLLAVWRCWIQSSDCLAS